MVASALFCTRQSPQRVETDVSGSAVGERRADVDISVTPTRKRFNHTRVNVGFIRIARDKLTLTDNQGHTLNLVSRIIRATSNHVNSFA